MSTEQAAEHSGAESQDTGTFNNVAAAVAELERREQSRKAERKAQKAEKPDTSDDDTSEPDEDEDPDPRKVQKEKPEAKEKSPKKEAKAKDEDEEDEDSDDDDEAEVTPDDDEDDDTEEPQQKRKAKPSLDDDADSEEIEHEGKTYRVPKPLKESFLRHSDYTRKTQELAQERQVVHQTYAQANESIQQVQAAQETLVQFAQAMVGSPPPLELAEANPGEYLRQRTLHEQRQQALAEIANQGQSVSREQQRLQQLQQAEQLREQEKVMVQHAPELKSPQARQQFAHIAGQYLQQFGFSPDDANGITDARTVLMVRRLLMLEHAVSQQQRTAGDVSKKLANVPSKTLKPGSSDRQGEGKRNTEDAKRRFMRSGKSMKDVEAYLKATSR